MDKCAQLEWVPQGLEAQKYITLHQAFNTVCLDRLSLRLASGKRRTIDKKVINKRFRKDASYSSIFFLLDVYQVKGEKN